MDIEYELEQLNKKLDEHHANTEATLSNDAHIEDIVESIKTNGVSRSMVVTLEGMYADFLPDGVINQQFTAQPSDLNADIVMESLIGQLVKGIAGTITAIVKIS